MKTAISIWNDRVSPVFDSSRRLLLLEIKDGKVLSLQEREFRHRDPVRKLAELTELKAQVLICGAISRPLHEMLLARDVRVVCFVSGDLKEVIAAWLQDELESEAFIMPGCCPAGRRRGLMSGPGGGRGRGGAGRVGRNRECGERLGLGPSGFCLCPRCRHREPHERGVPCSQRQCPQCGTAMVRDDGNGH